MSDRELLMEDVLDLVLGDLDGIPDDDTIRTRLLLKNVLAEVRGFERPRPNLLAGLLDWIAGEPTAAEVRESIRRARGEIAAVSAGAQEETP